MRSFVAYLAGCPLLLCFLVGLAVAAIHSYFYNRSTVSSHSKLRNEGCRHGILSFLHTKELAVMKQVDHAWDGTVANIPPAPQPVISSEAMITAHGAIFILDEQRVLCKREKWRWPT